MFKKNRYFHCSKIFKYLNKKFVLTKAKLFGKILTIQFFVINILFVFILKKIALLNDVISFHQKTYS